MMIYYINKRSNLNSGPFPDAEGEKLKGESRSHNDFRFEFNLGRLRRG
jgi:hypothetical protein